MGLFPGKKLEAARKEVEEAVAAAAQAKDIHYNLTWTGFQAEGCLMDPSVRLATTRFFRSGRPHSLVCVVCNFVGRHDAEAWASAQGGEREGARVQPRDVHHRRSLLRALLRHPRHLLRTRGHQHSRVPPTPQPSAKVGPTQCNLRSLAVHASSSTAASMSR